jgi:hypothetical protein
MSKSMMNTMALPFCSTPPDHAQEHEEHVQRYGTTIMFISMVSLPKRMNNSIALSLCFSPSKSCSWACQHYDIAMLNIATT